MGFEVLAKEGYDKSANRYRVGISGDNVPAAKLVRVEVTTHVGGNKTATFTAIEEDAK